MISHSHITTWTGSIDLHPIECFVSPICIRAVKHAEPAYTNNK